MSFTGQVFLAPRSLLIFKYFLEKSMCSFKSCWNSLSKEQTSERKKKTGLISALCVVGLSQCQQARLLRKVLQRLPLSEVACALLELFDRSC